MLSTSYSLTAEINRQSALETSIAQLQTNISSGIQVHVASDDPMAAAQIASIGRQQANETVYASNVKVAQATTSLVDTNLSSVQTSLNRAKELMLEASNGTMTDSARTAAITELQGIASSLNTAATATDSSGNPLFVQGSAATQVPIGNGTTVAAADSYDEVFGSVTLADGSTTSIADVMSAAITALQTTDATARTTAVNSSLDALDASADHITDAQSDIGLRETQLNNTADALANSAINLTDERSGFESTDLTAAAATLSSKMTTLNAAQSVLATLSKISLFDKIT
jgi:flagellin-like hook-associated protein FlgL